MGEADNRPRANVASLVGAETIIPSFGANRSLTWALVAKPRATRASRKRLVLRAYDCTSGGELLGKNGTPTGRMRAKELSYRQQQGQVPTSTRKIGDATCVVTMDAPRLLSTHWTTHLGRA